MTQRSRQDKDFNGVKEIADRAMKLAEIGKKSPIMDIIEWVIRAAIFAAG